MNTRMLITAFIAYAPYVCIPMHRLILFYTYSICILVLGLIDPSRDEQMGAFKCLPFGRHVVHISR